MAAHYCPSPEDEHRLRRGGPRQARRRRPHRRLRGRHRGHGERGRAGRHRRWSTAARAALEAAIAAAGPGVPIWRALRRHRSTLRGFGVRPMRNLCGHHVGRWIVHCPPPIPNLPDGRRGPPGRSARSWPSSPSRPKGRGRVVEEGEPEVFRLLPGKDAGGGGERPECARPCIGRRGLPFSRRDLRRLPAARGRRDAAPRCVARGVLPPTRRSSRPAPQGGPGGAHPARDGRGVEVLTPLNGPPRPGRPRRRLLFFGEVVGQGLGPRHDAGDVGIDVRVRGRPWLGLSRRSTRLAAFSRARSWRAISFCRLANVARPLLAIGSAPGMSEGPRGRSRESDYSTSAFSGAPVRGT